MNTKEQLSILAHAAQSIAHALQDVQNLEDLRDVGQAITELDMAVARMVEGGAFRISEPDSLTSMRRAVERLEKVIP